MHWAAARTSAHSAALTTVVETDAVLLLVFGSLVSLLTVAALVITHRPLCALTFTPMLVATRSPEASRLSAR